MNIFALFTILLSLPVAAQDLEQLSWNEASINEKISLTIAKKDFDKKYKADSIAVPKGGEGCMADDLENVRMVYYKGVKFEMDNGIMNFRSIDFSKRKNMYFAIKDDWFDHSTTLKSFSKSYPEAAAYVLDEETADGEPLEMITLMPQEGDDDYEWRFYFKNGKLHSIVSWFYCE